MRDNAMEGTMARDFLTDAVELAAERVERGELDRRTFLEGLSVLGVAGGLGGLAGLAPGAARPAAAQAKPKEVVMANWGGEALKHFHDAWGKPYEADTGIKVVVDGGGPTAGKIRAMVQAKNVVWDVADAGPGTCLQLGKAGLLEDIDYGVVDKGKVIPAFAYRWGVANYLFSYVLAYDKSKFGNNPPKTWKDFWDVKAFPGKRLMRKDLPSPLEQALMADGVPPDPAKIYPIDEKRAHDMIRKIKEHSIFWATGAQSQEAFRTGEVTMGCIWNTRATALFRETQGRVDFTWNQAILSPAVWAVPKGNPAGKWAFDFIKSMQIPERQVALLVSFGNGPANPAAAPLVPPELRRFDPGYPDNAKLQLALGAEWYGDNQEQAIGRYLDVISS
jgi:putative spermidine/putrescine transport system substrate-binding protein